MRRTVALFLLMLAAGWATACNNSTSPSPTPSPMPSPMPPASGMTVSIVQGASALTTNAYSPNPLSVTAGSTVIWTNNDRIAHTTTADGGRWDSGVLQPGAQFSFTFSAVGTFPYHCSIHPNMVGTITVR